ncbi:MAG: T9SS type A sorting domain-containing protein [Saprospiraceae bacterium]
MKNLLILLICISSFGTLSAQWESMQGPFGGHIDDLKKNDQFVFAATTNGLFRSHDDGETWQRIQVGNEIGYSCFDIGILNSTIVVEVQSLEQDGLKAKLYRSENNGDNWHQITRPGNAIFNRIEITHDRLYLADDYNLWASVDSGYSWFPESINTFIDRIHFIGAFDDHLYVVLDSLIFKSEDSGNSFIKLNIPTSLSRIYNLYVDGDLMLAQNGNGRLCRSVDGGHNWSIPNTYIGIHSDFIKFGNAFFAKGEYTMFSSQDEGKTWTDLNSQGLSYECIQMIALNGKLLVRNWEQGILTSADEGLTFHSSNKGLYASKAHSLLIHNNRLLVGNTDQGISQYDFDNSAWETEDLFSTHEELQDIHQFQQDLYIISGWEMYKSNNAGATWEKLTDPFNLNYYSQYFTFQNTLLVGGGIYSGNPSLRKRDFQNNTWLDYKCDCNEDGQRINVSLFASHGDTIFSGTPSHIFRSIDGGVNWEQPLHQPDWDVDNYANLYFFDNVLYALGKYAFSSEFELYFSSDNGDNWTPGGPLPDGVNHIVSLNNINGILIANTNDNSCGVIISFDHGMTWQKFNEGLILGNTNQTVYDDTYLYIGTEGQGVWRRKISDLYMTSTHQPIANNDFSVFPNPSNGNFTLKLDSKLKGSANLKVYDLSGKIYLNEKINLVSLQNINTNKLGSGLYMLVLKTNENMYTTKFVIQD